MLPDVVATTEVPALELTRSCVLSCCHCRASASKTPHANELSTRECMAVMDSLASMGRCIVILTGGEPLLRDDILRIARYGCARGLRMVMATCGMLLDREKCAALREAGIERISFSIDGATARTHDSFRGSDGAYDGCMKGIDAAGSAGLEFQINMTITKRNLPELGAIYEQAQTLGAVSFHPFLLVPTGRARGLDGEVISAEEYERTLNWMYERNVTAELKIKPTCAPHYYRILRQREQAAGREVTLKAHGLDAITKGCLGGRGFAFISHTGKVQICGFLEIEAGDLRASQYDFARLWRTSPLFARIRAVSEYHGKCGYCDYGTVCGGCRARAYAATGDYLGEEPQCLYQPREKERNDRG
jgi:heme b synthase